MQSPPATVAPPVPADPRIAAAHAVDSTLPGVASASTAVSILVPTTVRDRSQATAPGRSFAVRSVCSAAAAAAAPVAPAADVNAALMATAVPAPPAIPPSSAANLGHATGAAAAAAAAAPPPMRSKLIYTKRIGDRTLHPVDQLLCNICVSPHSEAWFLTRCGHFLCPDVPLDPQKPLRCAVCREPHQLTGDVLSMDLTVCILKHSGYLSRAGGFFCLTWRIACLFFPQRVDYCRHPECDQLALVCPRGAPHCSDPCGIVPRVCLAHATPHQRLSLSCTRCGTSNSNAVQPRYVTGADD